MRYKIYNLDYLKYKSNPINSIKLAIYIYYNQHCNKSPLIHPNYHFLYMKQYIVFQGGSELVHIAL